MEVFALLLYLPLLGLSLLGCGYFWRLINHGSTGGRVAGWLFFIPSVLLTLFSLLMVVAVFNPSKPELMEADSPPAERR